MTSEQIARICESLDAILADHPNEARRKQLFQIYSHMLFDAYFNMPEPVIRPKDAYKYTDDPQLAREAEIRLQQAMKFMFEDQTPASPRLLRRIRRLAKIAGIEIPNLENLTQSEAQQWYRQLLFTPPAKPKEDPKPMDPERRKELEKRLWR